MLKHHWLNWLIKAWFVNVVRRIRNFIGDIGDPAFLSFLCESIQRIDIIVDDASHLNWHQKLAFEALYPCLNPNGGIYIVEDIGTSYKTAYGGSEGMWQSFAGPDGIDAYPVGLRSGLFLQVSHSSTSLVTSSDQNTSANTHRLVRSCSFPLEIYFQHLSTVRWLEIWRLLHRIRQGQGRWARGLLVLQCFGDQQPTRTLWQRDAASAEARAKSPCGSHGSHGFVRGYSTKIGFLKPCLAMFNHV